MTQFAPAAAPSLRALRADAVIAVDSKGGIVFWSSAAQRLFGFRPEDVAGRSLSELLADDRRSAGRRHTTALRSDGTRIEVEVESESWQWRKQDLTALYIRDFSGHDRWLSEWSDAFLAVQRLLAEAESFESIVDELLGTLGSAFGATAAAVWLLGADTRHLRCRWFRSTPGRDVEAFRQASLEIELPLGIGLPGRVCADARAERISNLEHDERTVRGAEAARSGITASMGFPLARDGEVCGVLELSGDRALAPLDDSLEQMMITVGRQLARLLDRDRAVEELRRARQTFLEAEHFAHIGSFDRNLAAGTTRWSDELYRLFGYEPHQIEPTIEFVIEAVVPEEREPFRARLLTHLREKKPLDIKYTIARPDGERRVLRVRAMTIASEGQPDRLVGKVLDVTDEEASSRERRELEKQLAQASRMSSLGRLAATMAHEFNNVLMGIETFVKLLERRNDPATRETAISRIQQSLRRGRTVTDEILRFTRAAKPLRTTIDVRSWLRDFLPEALALTDGMTTLEVSGDGLIISGDVSQLNQVLANLVLNARDASPRGAKIEITAARVAGDRLDLTVADRGAGIPDDIRTRIFEPLFTTKRSGTGLGLAVVHQVIEAHDGEVRVESEMGRGTRFHLLLPLIADRAAVRRLLPERVVIVEDDPSVAAGLSALLESEGIEVEIAASARDAMELLERQPPGAIIVDVGLPDMMGTELYDRIELRWPHLPVIFITSSIERVQIEAYLMHPHAAFLRKPFEGEQLLDALARVTIDA
ncbi:MAG TPA: ATP-binding protein [Thermoanaerobaculia bacterium]|jgi:PAS domain S-box-containing protein|nr:ATP-binding protein [Thermoanaerobaculia bacterium]